MFSTLHDIFITTNGYHYDSVLSRVSGIMGKSIERQRCLFHIEKDVAHRIKDARKGDQLDGTKRLIKFMFFQNKKTLENPGKNKEDLVKLIDGKSEKEIFEITMKKMTGPYGGDMIICDFLDFVKKHRNDVFLYLRNPEVEKTSDKAEQHFSIQSWLFRNRFKTRDCKRRSRFVQNRQCKIDPPHINFHSLFSPLLSVGSGFFFLSFSL
jgi:hypothetical protein